MLCIGCNARNSSSVLSVIVPRLPLHLMLEGKLTKCSSLLSRSPNRPQCICASKVSILNFLRSATDISRFDLDATASTPRSMELPGTLQSISVWFRIAHPSVVSDFAFLHLTDVYTLDLEPSASTPLFNESIRTLYACDGWP